ncbi:MAG: RICIN domain-containing protein [candidate division SR1 bacterium]|nr:RICIN domain-containing protein [candidate division SR1 bacterium]
MNSLFRFVSLVASTVLVSISSTTSSKAADQYGFPNLNGKVVKLELENGVRVNLPTNRAIDNYQLNSFVPDNTDDWKFKIIDNGSGGIMFTRVNTNKAITVSNLNVVNGTSIVAYEQAGNGRWIDWNPEHVGNGYYLIHLRHNPSQCLNIPGSQSNVWVTTWTCDRNDRDQRMKIEEVAGNFGSGVLYHITPVPVPISQPVIQTTTLAITPLYEAWIVSRKFESPFPSTSNIGHSFIAIIRKNQKVVVTYKDGYKVSTSSPQDDGNWNIHRTYGYWPKQGTVGAGPGEIRINNDCNSNSRNTECQDVKDILRGISISNRGQAIRKSRISESRANWIDNNRNVASCSSYNVNGIWYGYNFPCNCVTYATLQWSYFTAKQDNWIPATEYGSSPDAVMESINSKNRSTNNDFIDSGNTWN